MSDLISRQDAIDALSRGSGCGNSCRKAIENLPSAQRWIPCSERLPELEPAGEIEYVGHDQLKVIDNTFEISKPVLTTRKTKEGYEILILQWENDGRIDCQYWVDDTGEIRKNVIAWMPLPEPYKEEPDD